MYATYGHGYNLNLVYSYITGNWPTLYGGFPLILRLKGTVQCRLGVIDPLWL